MLRDLIDTCYSPDDGKFELQECLISVLRVVRSVNDSLHRVNITNLPPLLLPLGTLICQDTFTVVTENKSQSQILFRNKPQSRHVLLYDNFLIFCRKETDHDTINYQYKFSLPVQNIALNTDVEDSETQIELVTVTNGQSDVYILDAKDLRSKIDFCQELSRLTTTSSDVGVASRRNISSYQTSSDLSQSRRLRFSRSRSLESRRKKMSNRSRSLDTNDNSDDGDTEDNCDDAKAPLYKALADYSPTSTHNTRELSLEEGELVSLVKIGCAGWWFVRSMIIL